MAVVTRSHVLAKCAHLKVGMENELLDCLHVTFFYITWSWGISVLHSRGWKWNRGQTHPEQTGD